ncbi:MAG: site-specific DNA-methyltransferase [Alphaproteobacteria bacterium]|nr:site-specific DNA-methyltransferase [Alphaproteobacteria bacterium]
MQDIALDAEALERKKSKKNVFGHERHLRQPTLDLPPSFKTNARNQSDGLVFLDSLKADAFPLCIFDPQYRGVLDRQKYGNEGERQKDRAKLEQMDDALIGRFIEEIGRVLIGSGHLLLWLDKYHLCTGVAPWIDGTDLETVDLIVWNKMRIGMGYRTRRTSEYLLVLQKKPLRAKGVWKAHDIPDVWNEKLAQRGGHAKPVGLQSRLIDCLTNPGDTVIDPAAGTFSVFEACKAVERSFLGCDLKG